MKIFVSNLSFEVTDEEIRKEFEGFGQVTSVIVVKNKQDGTSRGFGFVEMLKVSEGQDAISGLNGKVLKERPIVVSPAQDWSAQGGGKSRKTGGRPGGFSGGRDKRY